MCPPRYLGLFLAAAAMAAATAGHAREAHQSADSGKRDYQSSCAICHGVNGKGDGTYARAQSLTVPDLRFLAARNQGEFPYRYVADIIDGRRGPVIHGIPGMPVWGDIYSAEAAAQCRRMRCSPESVVRARVRALAEYLSHLESGGDHGPR